jgi:hypothetical protein
MYALLFCVLGVLPQAERKALMLHKGQVKQEARLRDQYPGYYAARQAPQPVPQTVINIYAPIYSPSLGYPVYNSPAFGGYGYGRPAWPPQW